MVADATSILMVSLWIKVLDCMSPNSTLAFPDFEGKPVAHLERKVEKAAKTVNHNLPTLTNSPLCERDPSFAAPVHGRNSPSSKRS